MLIALTLTVCLCAAPADAKHRHHHARAPHHAKIIHIPPAPGTARGDADTRTVLDLARRHDGNGLRALAARTPDQTVAALARWFTLSDETSNASFDELDAFLKSHPGWPRQAALQSFAEKRMPKTLGVQAVLAWFKNKEPETGIGAVRLGEAEMAAGDKQHGADRIRRAWLTASFDRASEIEILAAHGDLLTQDVQDGRLAHLLYDGDRGSIQRQRTRASRRAVQEAILREALQKSPRRGLAEYAGSPLKDDADVMFDAARAYRQLGRSDDARRLLLRTARSDAAAAIPDSLWWPELVLAAREALKSRDYAAAYDLVSRHRLDQGSDYADAEFLAGWIALKHLGKPEQALTHFQNLAQAVSRPISVARAHYWIGRAFDALKKPNEARAQYGIAAAKPNTFYGQLALARVESRPILPLVLPRPAASPDALAKDSRADAFRRLAAAGARDLAREFALRMAKDDLSEAKAAALIGLAKKAGDPALALKIAKLAEYQDVIVDDALHPTDIPGAKEALESAPIPKAEVLAFVRQESAFDTGAVSRAGARGLMQVMPATAKQRARNLGLPYSPARLTSDPQYNVRLGTMHLRAFFEAWRGSYVLAIASYNAGAGNVRKWIAMFGDPRNPSVDVIDWIESIPFAETRNYVQRIIENITVYRNRLAGGGQPVDTLKMLEPGATAAPVAERSVTKPQSRVHSRKHHKTKRRTMTAELR